MKTLLLNCDLGEWEPPGMTAKLMAKIDIANIACGGHAGTEETIKNACRLADENSVQISMHPGLPGMAGRSASDLGVSEFEALLQKQCSFFQTVAGREVNHIKLHGALYHLTENDAALRGSFADFVRVNSLRALCLAGGEVARELGELALEEAFLDRGYQDDGSLVPRGEEDALIHGSEEVAKRLSQLFEDETLTARSGKTLSCRAGTLCVHSDSPDSLTVLTAARMRLDQLKRARNS